MPRCLALLIAGFGLLTLLFSAAGQTQAAELPPPAEREVDFTADIQPLFAARCLSCHGADKHEGGLRLHRKADALAGGDRGAIFQPGNSAESRIVQLVSGEGVDGVTMPPEGDSLTHEQIGLLRAWIDQGAAWPDDAAERVSSDHWSFQPVATPQPPEVRDAAWVRNPIDRFILARLEAEGIAPSPEADRPTLIRRLSLDLTGLPPTPSEVEAFVNDAGPMAWENLVDRLLSSPHYGERWGRHWLDQARYADSDGYEKDTARPFAWRWRNWVIDAVNSDLPFDRFTIEQIAGDLLPDATLEQRIATGFHRNTLTNTEGGADQEEFRVAATVDRVNTTGAVWLGLTVGCAQCHSHKYDPISQREYYGLFAYFNSQQETQIPAPLPEEVQPLAAATLAWEAEHARLAEAAAAYERDVLPVKQAAWEQGAASAQAAWIVLDTEQVASAAGATLTEQPDLSLLVGGENPDRDTYSISANTDLTGITAVRLEVLPDPALPAGGPGRVAHGNFVLSEFRLAAASIADPAQTAALVLENATADFAQGADMNEFPASAAVDGNAATGWAVAPQYNQRHVAVFEVQQPAGYAGGTALSFTLDQQHGLQHTIGRLRLSITTGPKPVTAAGLSDELVQALRIAAEMRTPEQAAALTAHYRGLDAEFAALTAGVAAHDQQRPQASANALVLVELPQPRVTNVLTRGDFLRPGDQVTAQTPAVLAPLASGGGQPRLDFARWLVDPANPLTARVTMNRFWQQHFGQGLVTTGEDFGTRGEKPSHPELLDWLAAEFMDRGWSMKHMHRVIVGSAAYRQSSRVRPELQDRDPKNVLLARQSRFRVEAEVIRDLALAASGLLSPKVGGPSVRPPQPPGISELTYANSARWEESQGEDRYRRGMYTHFQRTSPYPMLMTFDSPDSNVCAVRRERSNTPLQALTLMNDAAFVECAQSLGRRLIAETPAASADAGLLVRERIRLAFRLCLSREPEEQEAVRLQELYAELLPLCQANPAGAAQLAGAAAAAGGDVAEAAAWVAIARTVLNLDEFVSRE